MLTFQVHHLISVMETQTIVPLVRVMRLPSLSISISSMGLNLAE
jgi:hypothetical protein